jgi:hypothetical protein
LSSDGLTAKLRARSTAILPGKQKQKHRLRIQFWSVRGLSFDPAGVIWAECPCFGVSQLYRYSHAIFLLHRQHQHVPNSPTNNSRVFLYVIARCAGIFKYAAGCREIRA